MTAASPIYPAETELDEIAEPLLKLFGHRSSATACLAQRAGRGATEKHGLHPHHIREHVAGDARYGAIPFVDDTHVLWAAIDLDCMNWGIDPDDPEAFDIINGIVERLAALGMRGMLERSKSKGWHIWVFFDRPVQARDIRALLRRISLEAGARDESDLICPRQDRLPKVGNGMWLPLFGRDPHGCTRFYVFDPDTEDWVEAEDQAEILRDLHAHPSPAAAVPHAPDEKPPSEWGPRDWRYAELATNGITLEAVVIDRDSGKIQFACPIHVTDSKRTHGGSAVMWSDGHGHCSSTKCDRRWRGLAELVRLVAGDTAPRRSELAEIRFATAEEIAADMVPEALVEGLLYRGCAQNIAGPSKTGKGYLTTQLTACVATGTDFLGLKTTKGIVAYVSMEMTLGVLRDRIAAICRDCDIPRPKLNEELFLMAPSTARQFRLDYRDPEMRARLFEQVTKICADLLILDTVTSITLGGDQISGQEMAELFACFRDDALHHGLAILTVDHMSQQVSRGEVESPTSQSAYGSVHKATQIAQTITLRRAGSGRWKLDNSGYFATWDDPIFYQRPEVENGKPGTGCVRCTETEARGVGLADALKLFAEYGEKTVDGYAFASKTKMIEAIGACEALGRPTNKETRERIANAIKADFAAWENAPDAATRPVRIRASGQAHVFTWIGVDSERWEDTL